jgi:hypothetical protein
MLFANVMRCFFVVLFSTGWSRHPRKLSMPMTRNLKKNTSIRTVVPAERIFHRFEEKTNLE